MRRLSSILLVVIFAWGCRSPAILEEEPCPPFCPCGPETDCEDGSECTLDYCDDQTGSCLSVPLADGIDCDDGLACTDVDSCRDGVCAGEPLDCTAFDDDCRIGMCDEGSGQCISVAAREGESCDDGLFCTGGDSCAAGECRGLPVDCDDGDPCTVETCDEALSECVYTPAWDQDGDGYTGPDCGGDDCDDADPFRHPDVLEVCDGQDNDCDPDNPDGIDEPDLGAVCDMAAGPGARLCLDGGMFCEPDAPPPWTVWERATVGSYLQDIHSPDGQNLWISGRNEIYHSADRGQTWRLQATLPEIDYIDGLFFTSVGQGWVCGRTGFLAHTTDGGESWTTVDPGTAENLMAIFMLDASTGWAVGTNGTVVATFDGVNWAPQTTPVSGWLGDVVFVDAQRGWAVGWEAILRTVDGGQNWESLPVPAAGNPESVHFLPDGQTGWIGTYPWGSSACFLLRTGDAGDTWEVQILHEQMYCDEFVDIDFLDDLHGYALNERGDLFLTPDGGESWLYGGYVVDDGTSLQFLDLDHGVALGRDGEIMVTRDGAATWQYAEGSYTYNYFNGLSFHHRRTGWAWSYYGLYRSEDGGYSWEKQDSDYVSVSRVWAFPGDFALAQSSGTTRLVVSRDAGLNWEPFPIPFEFEHINVLDPQTLILTNAESQVIKTLDGGATWETIEADISLTNASVVEFFSTDFGYIRDRYNGAYSLTRDGGATWTEMTSPFTDGYETGLCFGDALGGWLVGTLGQLARTEDGGESWSMQDPGTLEDLGGVQCISALEAWVIGDTLLLHTQDGGESWVSAPAPVNDATRVLFLDDQVGFVMGRNQLAVTRTGGQ